MKCNQCEFYKQEANKYKAKYEMAKSGLTQEEKDLLVELICNEQLLHMIANDKYQSKRYGLMEELKIKIKTI